MKHLDSLLPALATLLLPLPASAGPPVPEPDKSQYHLFNPTPRELMRELSPDRPDATESPITLDAGHYAVEVSVFDWRHDGRDDSYTAMATNFKVGLTNNMDLQTVFDAYTWEEPEAGEGAEGFSDAFRARAGRLLSLSKMTLPHELARAVLAEQLYRAFAILRNHPYPR